MKKSIGALFAAALLSALLGACGGSSSPTVSTVTVPAATALSKAQFIAQADSICQTTREETEPLKDRYRQLETELTLENEASQYPKLAEVMQEITAVASGEVEQIRSLQPPSADQVTINKMLALVDSGNSLTEGMANAFASNNPEDARPLLEQAKPISAKAQGIAQGYGFEVCGSG